MQCPSCNEFNEAGSSFCGHCGASLAERTCASCGNVVPPNLKFCTGCGSSLSEAAAHVGEVSKGWSRGTLSGPAPSGTISGPGRRTASKMPTSFASGRYVVKQSLGEGAKKVVYLAQDNHLDREVAFALLKSEALDPESLARVRREAQAMGRLGDHPNIITIFDIGDENGRPYMVSQYMRGGSVADLLAQRGNRPIPTDDAITICEQICDGLAHAHERGIVHRDLKPGNVWLDTDGTARLGDFGLAVASDRTRMTVEGLMVGTVSYMPPEQAAGRGADARSDLYSLGAMLYEMVTGRPPFTGDDTVAIISQHLNTPPVSASWHNDKVPPALDSLITHLLAKNPEERPASAAAVRERLYAIRVNPSETAAVVPSATHSLTRVASAAFVGREQELATLKSALEGTLSGQGSPIFVVGEPGIGKTRLVEEASVYANLRGAIVLKGRCQEGEGTPAFWPWVQIVRSFVHDKDAAEVLALLGPGAADIAQIVPEVHEKLPGLPASPSLEPEQQRFRLFDSMTGFLKRISAKTPLVIALDDLQWADKPSLLLVEFLGRELAGNRILLVGTYRDVEVDRQHPLQTTLAALRRERLFERIVLKGLSSDDVVQLLGAFAQDELPPEALVLAGNLHRATDGNPFFIEEVIRHLVETGRLYHRDGRWSTDLADLDFGAGFAEGVRELMGQRLARLSELCNRVLTHAAVVGTEFDLPILERVTGLSGDELLDVVDEAERAGVLEEVGTELGRYAFVRRAIRTTLYEQLSATRRVRLHRSIGETLEQLYGDDPDSHAAQLAHHFFVAMRGGGDSTKAVRYCRLAGEQARNSLAFEEAVREFDRAIEAEKLRADDKEGRCEILLALADAQWRSGELAAARNTCVAAARLARELGDADLLARAALNYGAGIGGYGFADLSDQNLVHLLEEALDALSEEDSMLRVRLLSRLAVELYFSSDEKRRDDASAGAVAMAERLRDPEARLIASFSRAQAIWGPDSLDESTKAVETIIRLAEQVGDKEMSFRGHAFRLAVRLELGDMRAVDDELRTCEALATELRQPMYQSQVTYLKAMRALADGRFEEASVLSAEALALGKGVHESTAFVVFAAQTYQLNFQTGRLDEIEEATANLTSQYTASSWSAALAFLYARNGKEDLARSELDRLAQDGFTDIRRDAGWILGMFLLAGAVWYANDADRAATLYMLLEPYADRCGTVLNGAITLGSVRWGLGLLATTKGAIDAGIRHFEEAIRQNQNMGMRAINAPVRIALAKALLRRNSPGDSERALVELNAALEVAQELGMRADLEEAIEAKLAIQGVGSGDVSSSIQSVSFAVVGARPDLKEHAAPDGTVTIVFSDIAGSTDMTHRLGDEAWVALLQRHNGIVRSNVRAHGGYEVKAEGDGFMLAFASARRAIECAIAIQRELAGMREEEPGAEVHVRIGIHTGEVVREEDDFFGKHVILASRIAAKAEGSQILVSSLVKELTDSSGTLQFSDPFELELKGLPGHHRAYSVSWNGMLSG